MEWLAAAAFGLEGVVKQELAELGLTAKAHMGGARFEGTPEDAFRANLWLRCADRVLLIAGEGEARSFEELFQLAKSIPWEDLLPRDARFPVTGNCARSQLMSVRDGQAIIKKAVAERLGQKYGESWLKEDGADYPIAFSIHQDQVRLALDTSGDALNKRGYRTWVGEAPLRETLAAALVRLSPWQPGQPLHDPCCGTGTILIEAAWLAAHRAPGLTRTFNMEAWHFADKAGMRQLRQQAQERFKPDNIADITGGDLDADALALCKRHLKQAGLGGRVLVQQQDLRDIRNLKENTCVITNPPYGERLGGKREAESLYRLMRRLDTQAGARQVCVLTSHPGFERLYGKRAARRRRLYNGRLECEYLIFQ